MDYMNDPETNDIHELIAQMFCVFKWAPAEKIRYIGAYYQKLLEGAKIALDAALDAIVTRTNQLDETLEQAPKYTGPIDDCGSPLPKDPKEEDREISCRDKK
jgi:hypothetical protein